MQNSLHHGGNLRLASERFAVAQEDWLDLSTGISPWAWPTPALPNELWRALPSDQHPLLLAASQYYQVNTSQLIALPGSQLLLRMLPLLMTRLSDDAGLRVAIPKPGYREHDASWQLAGYQARYYRNADQLTALVENRQVDHVVIINPNNPTTEYLTTEQLLALRSQLPVTGVMLVDEAFTDLTPDKSCAPLCSKHNILVLRSIGKFFGLAGLRLAFLIGSGRVFDIASAAMQPWSVNSAAIVIGQQALLDTEWQQQQRIKISEQKDRLYKLLMQCLPTELSIAGAGLFTTMSGPLALTQNLYNRAAQNGILLRHSDDEIPWCRMGLPGNDVQFDKLETVLQSL